MEFKNRNNEKMKRSVVLGFVKTMVEKHGPEGASVDLKKPDYSVLVEIVRDVCCVSVLKDYKKYHKYNLQMAVRESIEKECEEAQEMVKQDIQAKRDKEEENEGKEESEMKEEEEAKKEKEEESSED